MFVKQDTTFDLHKVEEVLLEIWNAVWEDSTAIPEISIPDVTRILVALKQLKNHVIQVMEEHKEQVKSLEIKVMDLELQVKDTLNASEGSERDLLAQLQQSQSHIKLLDTQLAQSMNPDSVHQLEQEIATCHSKVEELENRNFELEEKVLAYEEGRSSSPTPQWLQEERQERIAIEVNSIPYGTNFDQAKCCLHQKIVLPYMAGSFQGTKFLMITSFQFLANNFQGTSSFTNIILKPQLV